MSDPSEPERTAYTCEVQQGVALVKLEEPMAQAAFGAVDQAGNDMVARLNEAGARNLFVDITELPYIGSALVALVVRLWKQVKDKGGRTVVAVEHDAVREVISLARLHEHWTLVRSEAEGLKVLNVKRGAAPAHGGERAMVVTDPTNPILAVLAVLGVVGAACGAVLIGTKSPLVTRDVALGITGGAALAGLVSGTLLVLGRGTMRRTFGVLALVVCAISIVAALALYGPAGT